MIKSNQSIEDRYYCDDLDETRETLIALLRISKHFTDYGYDRLMAMLDLRKRSEEEIENLSKYLIEATAKMETEYLRATKYSVTYNEKYATDINGYYSKIHKVFTKVRSHMSPIRNLLKKGRPNKRPSQEDIKRFDISKKELIGSSVMGEASFEYQMFPIEEQPKIVQNLYEIYSRFIDAEGKCMELCIEMLDREEAIGNSEVESNALLEKDRKKWLHQLKDDVLLLNDDIISQLKAINPVYQERQKYASEKAFAPKGFHKFNTVSVRHYFLIDAYECLKSKYEMCELAIWGKQHDVIDKVRKVVSEFDNLLPEYFKKSMMGQYIYFFCHWASNGEVKEVYNYFAHHYQGKYKIVGYAAVNNHCKTFNGNSVEYKRFINGINYLTTETIKIDLKQELSILLGS